MKKLLFAIIATTFAFAINLSADESDSRDKLQIGVKIGGNYSNVYDTKGDNFNADAKIGFVVGGSVSIPIGKFIAIQPELLFSQKGYKASGKVLGVSYDFTHTTSWIDVPILFAFKPIENLTLLAGPQYSYLLKKSYDFDNNAIPNIEEEFKNNNIRENTLCMILGADISMDNLMFGARLGWDWFNNNGDGTESNPRYKNVWFQATIGYRISL